MNRTPEDALRDVLHGAGDPVGPGSFDDVRARARKLDRRSRLLKSGAAAIVVLAVIGVAIPLLDSDDKEQPVITNPGPDRSTTTTQVDIQPFGLWPFATAAEADDKGIELPFNPTDPVETASAFLKNVVGMPLGELSSRPAGEHMLVENVLDLRTTTVSLAKLGTSDRWTVIGADADGLALDEVNPGTDLRVAGRATAFEGTVIVRVVTRALQPKVLGRAVLTGEMGELKPFRGPVPFEPDESGLGVVIAVTESAMDGSVDQAAAVPTFWERSHGDGLEVPANAPLGNEELVAVRTIDVPDDPATQDVVVLDTKTGDVKRTLEHGWSTVEGGVLDLDVSSDRRTVYVALSTSACGSEVRAYRLDREDVRRLGAGDHVAVSPDGSRLAVSVDSECDGTDRIEIRDLASDTVSGRYDVTGGRVGHITWASPEMLAYDVYEDDQTIDVHVLSDHGDDRVLEPPGSVTWSVPVAGGDGSVVMLASNGDVVVVDIGNGETLGTEASLGSAGGVVDFATAADGVVWVTIDHALHTDGRVLRRDVAMVAS